MKSRLTILSLTSIALIIAPQIVTALPLSHASAHHHAIAAASHRDAFAMSGSVSDAVCRARFPMQSWSYESCLQQLPASAAIGRGH